MSRPVARLASAVSFAAALGLAASACGGQAMPVGVGNINPGPNQVVIGHLIYIPRVITVKAGATVTWHFDDGEIPHNVDFPELNVKSPIQNKGTWSHTFTTPGSYPYKCDLHANMTGTVIVK